MTTHAANRTLNAFAPQLRLGLMGSILIVAPLFVAAQQADQARAGEHAEHASPAKLVEIVREATRQFIDVNNAGPAGYEPFLGCVSGQDHGAMGVHYVNGTLVGDGRCRDLAGKQSRSAGPGRADLPACHQSEPLQPSFLLRTARMGVARQSPGRIRGLE
jgi:hypothetical protein